jgi:PBP1b-binding outer membrane lipoprotein LpoB
MKTTKKIVSALVAVMLILTSCKKDKTLQPQKEEIVISDLPAWEKEADLVSKTETTLSDADYEKIKAVIGGVEVKFTISDKLQTLPYSATKDDLVTTYYYKWDTKKLTIYRQKNKITLEAQTKPGDAQLVFYTLK